MGKVPLSTLWLNLIVISGTWGSSFVFVKLITELMHPFAFAASRGFIAMSALLVWLALRGRRLAPHQASLRPSGLKNFRHMIVLGTTNGWLANALTAVAVSRVDSAVVAMLQASVPLMVAVLAHFFFVEEPFRARQFIGIMTGLTGILLIVGPIGVFGGRGSLLGIAAMLISAFCLACGTDLWPAYCLDKSCRFGLWSTGVRRCGRRVHCFAVRARRRVEPAGFGMALACDRRGGLLGGADSALSASFGARCIGSGGARSLSPADLGNPVGVGHPR